MGETDRMIDTSINLSDIQNLGYNYRIDIAGKTVIMLFIYSYIFIYFLDIFRMVNESEAI